MRDHQGTLGRVYGGDKRLLHFKDGTRIDAGVEIADFVDIMLRARNGDDYEHNLCPGCYMVALFDAAVTLARENGQSLTELGNSMANAFQKLAADPKRYAESEEITVLLDPDDEPVEAFKTPEDHFVHMAEIAADATLGYY